jgi:hypothetical protein
MVRAAMVAGDNAVVAVIARGNVVAVVGAYVRGNVVGAVVRADAEYVAGAPSVLVPYARVPSVLVPSMLVP